jgi:hypothetical protein
MLKPLLLFQRLCCLGLHCLVHLGDTLPPADQAKRIRSSLPKSRRRAPRSFMDRTARSAMETPEMARPIWPRIWE